MNNEATAKVLTAAIAFADALIEQGESVPDQWRNWICFKESALTEAFHGHPEKLENARAQLQHALDTLPASETVAAS